MSKSPVVLEFDPANHTYYLRGLPVPSVTQVISRVNDFLGVDEETLRTAQERGALVHRATVMYDQGELTLDELKADPELWLYVKAWADFRQQTSFEPLAIEAPVYSRRHRYAGTIDRVGPIRGVLSIIEIKTSAAVNPITALQLAAYQNAYNEGRSAAEKAKERWAVQLSGKGAYSLYQYKDAGDLSTFLACLQIHNWRGRWT